jgi:hypothetical protein
MLKVNDIVIIYDGFVGVILQIIHIEKYRLHYS